MHAICYRFPVVVVRDILPNMTQTAKNVRTNIHGVPLSEIEKRPSAEEIARTPRLPLHLYPDVPLYQDEHLRVRVKGSRVSLDSLAGFHRLGKTIDYLAEGFPSVDRSTIRKVIDFYLQERDLVNEYLDYNEKLGDVSNEFWESNFGKYTFKSRGNIDKASPATDA